MVPHALPGIKFRSIVEKASTFLAVLAPNTFNENALIRNYVLNVP